MKNDRNDNDNTEPARVMQFQVARELTVEELEAVAAGGPYSGNTLGCTSSGDGPECNDWDC